MICENAQAFLDLLEEKNMRPKGVRENEEKTSVIASVKGKNAHYDVVFLFDAERMVQMTALEVLTCPQNKYLEAIDVCNRMNSRFRWFKFYFVENAERFCLQVQSDAYIDAATSGQICMELLIRAARVIDEAYPDFMKAIWG